MSESDRAATGIEPTSQLVVVTGAAGRVGRGIVPLLRRDARTLRLLDIAPPSEPDRDPRDEWVAASITDREALATAFVGATAVIHLAGHASEMPWADILAVNIDGSQAVLEAAQRQGVQRVLLASTYHVVGYETPAGLRRAEMLPPRPDTYYAVSKAATEALGSVFADRFGMTIVSARICSYGARPAGDRGLAQWLSAGDLARLVEATIARDEPGHRIVWGVSRNAPDWFPLGPGRAIGFEPVDDAAEVLAEQGRDDLDTSSILGYVFVDAPNDLGAPFVAPTSPQRSGRQVAQTIGAAS